MQYRKIMAVYSENSTQQINMLCGQNALYLNVKAGGTHYTVTELSPTNQIIL
jgi:hypothetical protein